MLQKKNVGGLIKALAEEKRYVRDAALAALLQIGSPAVPRLCAALRHRSFRVRRQAADALEKIGLPTDSATQAWHAIAKHDWDRVAIMGASAVEALVAALKHSDSYLCERAAEALGKIGNPRAVEPLCVALWHQSLNVGRAAAQALGEIGDSRAVKALQVALSVRNTEPVRLPELPFAPDPDELYRQEKALQRDMEGRREDIREALARISSPAPRAPKEICLPADASAQARNAVAKRDWPRAVCMGALAVEPLCLALNERGATEDVRCLAARTLGEIGDPRAVEPLCAVLNDPRRRYEWTACAAAKALGEIGDARAVEPLCAALKNPHSSSIRWNAAEALGEIGDARASEALRLALKDEDVTVRVAAGTALRKIRGRHGPTT